MRESKVTTKGRTTLPREVRATLGLAGAGRVRYIILDNAVRILKVRAVRELQGMLSYPNRAPVSLEEMDAAIGAGAVESARARD